MTIDVVQVGDDSDRVTKPTRFQWLQIIALSLPFWLLLKVLIAAVLFGFFWGPG